MIDHASNGGTAFDEHERQLIVALRRHGGQARKGSLLRALSWEERQFLSVSQRLVDRGFVAFTDDGDSAVRLIRSMTTLRAIVGRVLRSFWAYSKGYREAVIECGMADEQPHHRWPDIMLVGIRRDASAGSRFDLISFEVRDADSIDPSLVDLASSHRRAATKAYVWLHVPESQFAHKETALEAVVETARQRGVGVITAGSPNDCSTWVMQVDAARVQPNHQWLREFLEYRLSSRSKTELRRRLRAPSERPHS